MNKLTQLLHPARFPGMSPKMAFIVGVILGEDWAHGPKGEDPTCCSFSITSDGFLISGDMFLGSAEDYERNIANLLQAAGLTDDQRKQFAGHQARVTTDWRNR